MLKIIKKIIIFLFLLNILPFALFVLGSFQEFVDQTQILLISVGRRTTQLYLLAAAFAFIVVFWRKNQSRKPVGFIIFLVMSFLLNLFFLIVYLFLSVFL